MIYVEILHKRFGRTQQIITSHMDELLKLPACPNDRISSLRYVYDKISVHIRGLASLGVSADQYGSLLIPVIMEKLPTDIRLHIARKATSEVWKIDELLEVIEKEVTARESSELKSQGNKSMNGKFRQKQDLPTANSLFTGDYKPRCVYCNAEHYSASFTDVSQARDRKEILRKAGHCFVCLKTNHKSRECNSSKNCRHCSGKHHQSICDRPSNTKNSTPDPPKGSTEEHKDETNQVTTTSVTTNNATNKSRTVLLQTARAVAYNEENNRSIPVRELFDNGSQRSYITDNACSKLGLASLNKERLKLNTFGESRYKMQNCEAVRLVLKKPGFDQSITINALSFPVLCSPLPKALQRRLLHDRDLLTEYDQIIKDELDAGIIERIPQQEINRVENVHYMPHHGVVRKDKQTTKLRVVYDGSATPGNGELSINDCLHPGPNLIPKLLDVLVKFRHHPVTLSADIEKAFLMISINESDQDMLRFLWFEEPPNPSSEVIHLRFTRLVFGLRPSPAILNSTIREHLKKYKDDYPDVVQRVEDSLYVDDLVSGAENDDKGFELYKTAKNVMAGGSFNLRKWQSNSAALMNKIEEIEVGVKNECQKANREIKADTI